VLVLVALTTLYGVEKVVAFLVVKIAMLLLLNLHANSETFSGTSLFQMTAQKREVLQSLFVNTLYEYRLILTMSITPYPFIIDVNMQRNIIQ
jgi:hypothetical protein